MFPLWKITAQTKAINLTFSDAAGVRTEMDSWLLLIKWLIAVFLCLCVCVCVPRVQIPVHQRQMSERGLAGLWSAQPLRRQQWWGALPRLHSASCICHLQLWVHLSKLALCCFLVRASRTFTQFSSGFLRLLSPMPPAGV